MLTWDDTQSPATEPAAPAPAARTKPHPAVVETALHAEAGATGLAAPAPAGATGLENIAMGGARIRVDDKKIINCRADLNQLV
ncbi:MAG: ribonucleotide-diphosphate reductase subunit beta, partial [Gammaproteobacteria bacterium]